MVTNISSKLSRSIWAILAAVTMLIAVELMGMVAPQSGLAKSDWPTPQPNTHLTAQKVLTLDVPILAYHHIGGHFISPYNISTKDFVAQMDYLAQHGYTTVSLDQIAAALRGQASLPACPVAITFDDGYAEQYNNARPVLLQHNFHATFYLVTGYISLTQAFMNWDQIKDLMRDGDWIGSHTYNHAFVGRLAGRALTYQIVDAKTKIESALGISISTFAYPYGSFSLTAQRLISDSGFTSAVWLGASYHESSERIYKLNRLSVYSGSLVNFALHLPRHGPRGLSECPPVTSPTNQ